MRNDRSFIELRARERAHALLDDGSCRELLDPFDGIMSPWLGARGIVPQSDDGMVVAKGTINGQPPGGDCHRGHLPWRQYGRSVRRQNGRRAGAGGGR